MTVHTVPLAATEATTQAARPAGDRRGPLRPGRLVASRARIAGPALSMSLRVFDAAVVVVIAVAAIASVLPHGLASASGAGLAPYALALAVLIISLSAVEAYGFRPRQSLGSHLLRIALAFAVTSLLVGIALVSPQLEAAQALKLWLAASFAALFLSHMAAWLVVEGLRRSGRLTPNVVIIGSGRNAERLIESALKSGEVAILGLFDDRAARASAIHSVPVLGDTAALINHKITPYIDRIIIGVPSGAQPRIRQLISRLSVLPNPITLVVDQAGDAGEAEIARLADVPLALVCGRPSDPLRATIKRAEDLVIGSIALLVGLPIMAIIALAVRLDSPGPVFFRQRRHGFNNEVITVWKFRSMRAEASDPTATRQVQADDDRVTRVGRFIRRTSLDE